jgi:DNA-binding transcriptional LysR family regulator
MGHVWTAPGWQELFSCVQQWSEPQPKSGSGWVAMEAFRASGLDYPRVTLVSNSAEVGVSLLVAGRFLTIAPSSLLRFPTRRAELKILPVELPMAVGRVGIVTLANRTLNPVAKLFIQHAREAAKPLARRK